MSVPGMVSATFSFKATAQDYSGAVQKMEFYVDSDSSPACTDTMAKPSGSTFQCNWNSTLKGNGTHTVTAKAYDLVPNSASSAAVTFTVNNPLPPVLSIAKGHAGNFTWTNRVPYVTDPQLQGP